MKIGEVERILIDSYNITSFYVDACKLTNN